MNSREPLGNVMVTIRCEGELCLIPGSICAFFQIDPAATLSVSVSASAAGELRAAPESCISTLIQHYTHGQQSRPAFLRLKIEMCVFVSVPGQNSPIDWFQTSISVDFGNAISPALLTDVPWDTHKHAAICNVRTGDKTTEENTHTHTCFTSIQLISLNTQPKLKFPLLIPKQGSSPQATNWARIANNVALLIAGKSHLTQPP